MAIAVLEKGKPMDDLISRHDAIKILNAQCYRETDYEDVCGKDCECAEYIALRDLPSAQKKGHWNFVGDNLFECTCCGKMYTTQQLNGLRVYDKDPYCPFFCPNCGADMRGEDDG